MFLEVYGNKMHEPELIKHSLRCISSLSFLTKFLLNFKRIVLTLPQEKKKTLAV